MTDSEVYANAMAGVTLRGQARGTLERNVVRDGRASGVYALESASLEMCGNTLRANRLCAIEVVGSDASVDARDNAIVGNGDDSEPPRPPPSASRPAGAYGGGRAETHSNAICES